MNFCNVSENLVSTILSAAIIAAVAWIYSFVRNLRLEAQLSDAINPNQKYLKFYRLVILNSLIHIRSSLRDRISPFGQNEMLNQVQTPE